MQHGAIVDTKGNPKKAHLLLFDNQDNKVLDFDTNDKGEFSFKLSDGNRFTLVAYSDDNSPLYIHKKERNTGLASKAESKAGIANPNAIEGFFKVKKPNQSPIKKRRKANLALSEGRFSLDEVVVTAYGISSKKNFISSVVTINFDDFGANQNMVQALQGKVSGVQITNTSGVPGSNTKLIIRGASSLSGTSQPLIVVDGIPLKFDGQMDINPDQVNSVTVLKDLAATTLYGSAASNGVLLISTKNQSNRTYGKKKLNNKKYNNYVFKDFYYYGGNSFDSPSKFYVPAYEGENLPDERTDFRQTIYWNPVVQTDLNGEAKFEFYNSDAISSFKITAEGVGYNGLLGRQEKDYSTKKLLNLDFKSPSYMTINDIVVLPLTIINESDETLFTKLELDLPENLQLTDSLDKNITIAAHSTIVKNVRVLALEKGEDIKIRATIKSDVYQDLVHKKVTILVHTFLLKLPFQALKVNPSILR